MNIDITRLKSGIDHQIQIDEEISFDQEKLKNTDILSLDNVKVFGSVFSNHSNSYDIDLSVSGIMILPSSLTLKPVEHPFEIKIEGNVEELLAEMNETSKKIQNTIDILPIIWENILMEIPMRIVSDESEKPLEGEGWRLITEQEGNVNPELQKLKDLLK